MRATRASACLSLFSFLYSLLPAQSSKTKVHLVNLLAFRCVFLPEMNFFKRTPRSFGTYFVCRICRIPHYPKNFRASETTGQYEFNSVFAACTASGMENDTQSDVLNRALGTGRKT